MGFHPTPLFIFEIKLPRYTKMPTQEEITQLAILATKEKIKQLTQILDNMSLKDYAALNNEIKELLDVIEYQCQRGT